jgi:hypothetical protein
VQIAHIPWSLINGLKHQRTTKKVAKEGLVVSLSQKDIAANPRISLPDHRFRFGDLSRGESFSVECWVEAKEHTPNATILDTRNGQGHGIWVGLAEKGKLAIELTDTSNRRERAHTAEDAFSEGKLHHVVINVDGASDVITIIVDGIISGDNPRMNFKQISRDLTSVHGTGKAYLGEPSAEVKSSKRALSGTLRHLRIYDRYLLTSEAIANYRAGIAQ